VWFEGAAFQFKYLKIIFDAAIEFTQYGLVTVEANKDPNGVFYFKVEPDIEFYLMPMKRSKEECFELCPF
jgi:hypothetical protein